MIALLLAAAAVQQFRAEPAPDWDALFDRSSGWTGADGVHAIPLDGDDRPGGLARADTLFLFSDTFWGEVTPEDARRDAKMVNNSAAWLPRGAFPGGIRFFAGEGGGGAPASLLVPATAAARDGEWYWPHDGFALDGRVRFFAHRFRRSAEGLGFARSGLALITLPRGAPPRFAEAEQADCPFYAPPGEDGAETTFGCALLPWTEQAGAPRPDGWLYVTGVRESPGSKRLLIARVRPAELADWSAWRFWDGSGWSASFGAAAPVCDRVSPEHSLSFLPDGRLILVFQLDTISRTVAARLAGAPQGPWSDPIPLWECPVPAEPEVWSYNAKAHPHLSAPGELLISYHLNPTDFWANFRHADAYRPRFVRLKW